MQNTVLKKALLFLFLGLMIKPWLGHAQIYSVNIKAVDAPDLRAKDGNIALASEERYGQGIIIDPRGIIATNKHIIGKAMHIYVALSDGEIYEGHLLRNSLSDLCLIKINASHPLRAIMLADSSVVRIGNNVTAISSQGSNPHRKLGGQVVNIFKGRSSHHAELLEINIPLKPGDSGGAILNEDGSLLGLIMGKRISDPSKSYAIASYRIKQEYFRYINNY
jgi:S1-C subfamily serine protease